MAENDQKVTADQKQPEDFKAAWPKFVKSVRQLLGPQVDDRPLDQFLAFRDAVLELVEDENFQSGLLDGFSTLRNMHTGVADTYLMELQAFPLAVEVAQASAKPE